MVEVLPSVGRLLAALGLVALNGFFVGSEFALVRVRSTAVDQMVEEGRAGAKTLADAMDHLDDYLAATQLGITVASLALGWIGEPAIAALIEPVLGSVLPSGTTHLIAVILGFSVVTFLHVVFGELAPKTIAIAEAERLALLIAPPMKFFYYIFLPGLVVFNGTANFFTSLIGVPPASETEETLSEDEIRMVLARAGKAGTVGTEEVEMIEQIFSLDDIVARDVMIPAPDTAVIRADTDLAAIRTFILRHDHTRYPVVDAESGERPIGGLDVKDVLRAIESGETDVTAGDLVHEIPIVPESTRVNDLLEAFQSEQRQLAAVIDEWGSLAGIATVEDVVEIVVGDLYDVYDDASDDPSITVREDGSYRIDGAVPLQAINETLETSFEPSTYGTVGGLVLDRLGRLPSAGDRVTVGGYAFEVTAVDGARIEALRVEPATDEGD